MTVASVSAIRPSRVWPVTRIVILTIGALIVLVPLLLLVSGSLMSAQVLNRGSLVPTVLEFNNFVTVWTEGGFGTFVLNSVIYSVIAVPLSVMCSAMAAFGFARLKFGGQRVFFGSVLSVLMFPIETLFIPVFAVLVSLNLVDTRLGYILAVVTTTLPLNTFIMHRFFKGVPKELEESATIDGAGVWRFFWTVCMPLVRGGLAATSILTFVSVWNEFILAIIIFRSPALMPVQQGLTQYSAADRPQQQLMLAAALLTLVPMIVFYSVAQKGITQGVMEGAVRG